LIVIVHLDRNAVRGICLVAALSLASCGGGSAFVSNGVQPAGNTQTAGVAAWRTSLIRNPLPGAGCFKASYPSVTWSRTACSSSLERPSVTMAARFRPESMAGNEWNASAPRGDTITTAIGSFPYAYVTGEHSAYYSSCGSCRSGANYYGIQINTNVYPNPAACKGIANCTSGWVQFVYLNPVFDGSYGSPPRGALTIWNILLSKSGTMVCPRGFSSSGSSATGCYLHSQAVLVPNQSIDKNGLEGITLQGMSGTSSSSGKTPYLSAYLTFGKTTVGMQWPNPPLSDIASHWQSAQFNLMGHNGGSEAIFKKGSTLTARLETQFSSGAKTAPTCVPGRSTTAESNSLAFVAAPKLPQTTLPSIVFKESNVIPAGSLSCRALSGSRS
jgi:hypothetical protein